MKRNIIIAAGGTGGHISPGMALAEYLQENKEHYNVESIYIHSLERNKDNPDLKESTVPIIWHSTPQIDWKLIYHIFSFLGSIIKTMFLFRKLKIHSVIAMGGYSSFPALLYALVFQKEIFLCEQNRIQGNVTTLFSRFAKKIAYSFPALNASPLYLHKSKVTGNPLRAKILPNEKILESKLKAIPQKEKINVLVMGGSQGARQINNMVISIMDNPNIIKNFSFRILTGINLYEETKEKTRISGIDLISYSIDMKTHYEWANLVIARSGAGVISECVAFGLPMILIPYPYAKDNHQKENAKFLEEGGSALVLYQRDENNTQLLKYLLEFSDNRNKLVEFGKKAIQLAKLDATKSVLDYFLEK